MTHGKLIPFRRASDDGAEISDETLLAACALRDRAALGALFDRLHQPVFRFLSRLVGARDDLDDLVQATFIEVQRSAARFRGGSTVRTWIFGIAANLARHHARGERRRRAMLGVVGSQPPSSGPPRPDEQAAATEQIARLSAALEELSHDHRAAFVMCDVEEVPGVEAAKVLNVREGTLWRRLYEARKLLRAALEGGR